MTPDERHEAALAALDRQIEDARKLAVEARRAHLALKKPRFLGKEIPGWGWWPHVERLMDVMVNQTEGRRRTLDRHKPIRDHGRFSADRPDQCPPGLPDDCGCRQEPMICASCRDTAGDPIPWEDCLDWADAAGLDVSGLAGRVPLDVDDLPPVGVAGVRDLIARSPAYSEAQRAELPALVEAMDQANGRWR